VAVGQQGNEKSFNGGILTDNGLADFGAEILGPSGTVDHRANVAGE
jgi:hypothetical protein